MIYQALNVLMLVAVVVMILLLYEHLELPENKELLLVVIGLGIDLIGALIISSALVIDTAMMAFQAQIFGRWMIGLGLVLYSARILKTKASSTTLMFWTIIHAVNFILCFEYSNPNPFVIDAYIVHRGEITFLIVNRQVMYHLSSFCSFLLGLWIFRSSLSELRHLKRKEDKERFVIILCYVFGVVFQSVSICTFQFGIKNFVPDWSPLCRGIMAIVYCILTIRYNYINYDSLSSRKVMESMGAGFIILNSKYRIMYFNTIAKRIFPDLVNEESIRKPRAELTEAVEKREFNIEKNGYTYKVTADRIYHRKRLEGYSILIVNISDVSELRELAIEANESRDRFLANMSHELRTPLNAIIGAAGLLSGTKTSAIEKEYAEIIQMAAVNLNDSFNTIIGLGDSKKNGPVLETAPYRVTTLLENLLDICHERAERRKIDFFVRIDPDLYLNAEGDDRRVRQILVNVLGNAIRYTDNGSVTLDVSGEPSSKGLYKYIFRVTDTGKGVIDSTRPMLHDEITQEDVMSIDFSKGSNLGLMLSKQMANRMGGDLTMESTRGVGSVFTVTIFQRILNKESFHDYSMDRKLKLYILDEKGPQRTHFEETCHDLGIEFQVINSTLRFRKSIDDSDKLQAIIYDYENYGRKVQDNLRMAGYLKIAILNERDIPCVQGDNILFVRRPLSVLTLQTIFEERKNMQKVITSENTVAYLAPTAHVLIVDDNDINLQVTKNILVQYGMQVETADSGYLALDLVETKPEYDLIFMDYMMEGMDGIEATRKIRALRTEYALTVPIIALTANAIEGAREKYLEAGMNDCVFKPIHPSILAKIAKDYLPKEKIILEDISEKKRTQEKEEIPEGLPSIPGIDSLKALKYVNRNVHIYKEMLADFANEIPTKITRIEETYEGRNFPEFTVAVHGLKGAARLLGANDLGDQMALMEQAGNHEDIDFIKNNLPSLLVEYGKYATLLQPIVEEMTIVPTKEYDGDEFVRLLHEMSGYLEDFEMASAADVMDVILQSKYDGVRNLLVQRLKKSIDAVDYYESIRNVKVLLERGKEETKGDKGIQETVHDEVKERQL